MYVALKKCTEENHKLITENTKIKRNLSKCQNAYDVSQSDMTACVGDVDIFQKELDQKVKLIESCIFANRELNTKLLNITRQLATCKKGDKATIRTCKQILAASIASVSVTIAEIKVLTEPLHPKSAMVKKLNTIVVDLKKLQKRLRSERKKL